MVQSIIYLCCNKNHRSTRSTQLPSKLHGSPKFWRNLSTFTFLSSLSSLSNLTAEMFPGRHINKDKGIIFDAESPRIFILWVSAILRPLPFCPISSLSNIYGARGQWNSTPLRFQAISNQNMKANATWRVLPYVIFSNLALQKLPRERFCGGMLLQQPDEIQPEKRKISENLQISWWGSDNQL